MLHARCSVPLLLMALVLVTPTARGEGPVAATVETTMPTHGDEIRQLAYDGRPSTFFATEKPASADDHFTLVFDRPVAVKSIAVTTGRPDGSGKIAEGALEVSHDGKLFHKLAGFTDGSARGEAQKEPVRAIRIKPGATTAPIAIRELDLVTAPPVPVFLYPVEFVVDVTDAPELKDWAEAAARTCEQAYPMINDELASDGFRPARLIHMKLSKTYRGVAATSGDRIVGSVEYFKGHRKDVGAMVHETTHVVQAYRRGKHPGWLVEGVTDYIRFFKYEPGNLGRINPRTAHHDGSYRVTAAFLAYLSAKYDRSIVRKLNAALREGRYDDSLFEQLTGKNLKGLDEEWRAVLKP
jgi:hypothetical protein